ncbi:hypothetical protein VTO42DRAFT_3704 [Malbranchea cinnamomea]
MPTSHGLNTLCSKARVATNIVARRVTLRMSLKSEMAPVEPPQGRNDGADDIGPVDDRVTLERCILVAVQQWGLQRSPVRALSIGGCHEHE